MKAIFYDRRNKREISSDQLCEINLVESHVVANTDKYSNIINLDQLRSVDKQIGTIGYLDEHAHDHQNWNAWTTENDLIFLRLEFDSRDDGECPICGVRCLCWEDEE